MTQTKNFLNVSIVILLILCSIAAISATNVKVAKADGEIYDLVTPALIKFYESDFNRNCPVTSLSAEKRELLTKKLQISSNKLNAFLILQDIAALNGKQVSLEKLNSMSLKELFQFGKFHFETYVNGLPKDQQEKIIADFKLLGLTFKDALSRIKDINRK